MSDWISVNDYLPDEDITVMTYLPDSNEPVWPGYIECGVWLDIDGIWTQNKVTHWQPFPDPPE